MRESFMEKIFKSGVHALEVQYLVKWIYFSGEENRWEFLAHLAGNEEFAKNFHQAYLSNKKTPLVVLQEAAENEVRRKTRADAAWKAKVQEALFRPTRIRLGWGRSQLGAQN
jgi:hypothetical protein